MYIHIYRYIFIDIYKHIVSSLYIYVYVYIAKTFKDDTLQELKIQYYELLNRICNDKDEYLDMANNHYCIFQTPLVQEKTELWTGESLVKKQKYHY